MKNSTRVILALLAISLLYLLAEEDRELFGSVINNEFVRKKAAGPTIDCSLLSNKRAVDVGSKGNGALGEGASAQVELGEHIKKGTFLRTSGILKEIIQDAGGVNSIQTHIPSPEVIIEHSFNGNVTFIRLLDTGCVQPNIPIRGLVTVSGTVVDVIPGFAIILDCRYGARVKQLKSLSP